MITDKDIENFEKIAKRMKCLLHPMKRSILLALWDKPMNGGEIDSFLNVEQSVGAQMRMSLRQQNLVTTAQKGKYVYYSTNQAEYNQLIEVVRALCPLVQDNKLILEMAMSRIRALNHNIRAHILICIANNGKLVCQKDLVSMLYAKDQSEVSAMLKILIDAGFVTRQKKGRLVYYKTNKTELKQFLKTCKIAEKWNTQ